MTARTPIEARRKVINLHHDGMTPNDITQQVAVSFKTAKTIIVESGLTPNTKRPGSAPGVNSKIPRAKTTHESYAIHSGGSTVVSHGLGKDSAERTLSAMIAPYKVVERGVRPIGKDNWKPAGEAMATILARAIAKHDAAKAVAK